MKAATVVALIAVLGSNARAASPGLQSSAVLMRSLEKSGRAEATLRFELPSMTGANRVVHATLALEPPVRARLDILATGEKIVARAEGGEWLQPATKQVLRFGAEQAAPALQWWRVLLAKDRSARERPLGKGHYVITLPGAGGAPGDSAEVWLDARGLPARLLVPAGDADGATYRLTNWRFTKARGEAPFHLLPPSGYETVELP